MQISYFYNMKVIDRKHTMEQILLCLERGFTKTLAIQYSGITVATYHNWLKDNPKLDDLCNMSKAKFVDSLLPSVIKQDPWKLLKSVSNGEYKDEVTNNLSVTINRPLEQLPSSQLLQLLSSTNIDVNIVDVESKQIDSGEDKELTHTNTSDDS